MTCRDHRRALMAAHWERHSGFAGARCSRCTSPIYGDGYLGTSLAVYDWPACGRDCAIELVDDGATRPTMEMAPITDDEAAAELRGRAVAR